MTLHASSVMAMPLAWPPEQLPASSRPAPPDALTSGQGNNHLRPLEVAACSLCGVERPLALLVPDGGGACTNIHWYCKDVKSCTDRWITALQRQPGNWPTPRDDVFAVARRPEPAALPAADHGGPAEQAQSVTEQAVT